MPGDNLIGTFVGSLSLGPPGAFTGSSTGVVQTVTGLYIIPYSTIAPAQLGTSTGRVDTVSSTSFTYSTNDIVIRFGFSDELNQVSAIGIMGWSPSSTGGLMVHWVNPSTIGYTPTAASTSRLYHAVVLRTT